LRVERASQSLAKAIEGLNSYLYWDFGVLKNPENAVKLRDALVQARAEGSGGPAEGEADREESEGQLRRRAV
jgi:hypothetical protein